MGHLVVFLCGGAGQQHPECVDRERCSQRELNDVQEGDDDGEDAGPGGAVDQSESGDDGEGCAADEDDGDNGVQPRHVSERIAPWTMIPVAEVVAEEAMEDRHGNDPAEDSPGGVGEPENCQGLYVPVDARVEPCRRRSGNSLRDRASAIRTELLAWRYELPASAAIHLSGPFPTY